MNLPDSFVPKRFGLPAVNVLSRIIEFVIVYVCLVTTNNELLEYSLYTMLHVSVVPEIEPESLSVCS